MSEKPGPDIRLELYVLETSPVTGGPEAVPDTRIALADPVSLRLLSSDRYAGDAGPQVLSFAVEFPVDLPPAAVARALWEFLRARSGGRGIITARLMRRLEQRRTESPATVPVIEHHELWKAIPLGSRRESRRRVEAFFAEVLESPAP